MKEFSAIEIQRGNPFVFEKLFNTWYESLCRYAYSILHNMNEAEDIVQKTFCKLWDQHKNLTIHSSVKSYLYRIVHNECMNRIALKKRALTHHAEFSYNQNRTVENTSEKTICSELEIAIEKAMGGLPPKCRQVFEMSRIGQESYANIATKLNISVNTVENHMVKALKMLRISLQEFLFLVFLFNIFNLWK